jgi:hypothetical protein
MAVAGTDVSEANIVAGKVSLGITVTGCAGIVVGVAGAQAATKMTSRLRLRKLALSEIEARRLFLIFF